MIRSETIAECGADETFRERDVARRPEAGVGHGVDMCGACEWTSLAFHRDDISSI